MGVFYTHHLRANAVKLSSDNSDAVVRFLAEHNPPIQILDDWTIEISTTEGIMTARHGDWLVSTTDGEVWPCSDTIFHTIFKKV
jgi:hypothetical protein